MGQWIGRTEALRQQNGRGFNLDVTDGHGERSGVLRYIRVVSYVPPLARLGFRRTHGPTAHAVGYGLSSLTGLGIYSPIDSRDGHAICAGQTRANMSVSAVAMSHGQTRVSVLLTYYRGFRCWGNECGKIWNRECRHRLMSALMISLVPGQSRVEVRTIPIWALGGLSFLRQNKFAQLAIHSGGD